MSYAPTLTAWSAAAHALLTARAGDVTVLVDSGVPESAPFLTTVGDVISSLGRNPVVRRVAPHAGLDTVAQLHDLMSTSAATVAIGGGSLLDAAKLVRLWAQRGFRERLTARTRSGFVALRPTMAQPATVLVAVPTTLGTGSESSSVAIADVAGRRRLVSGAHLRPDSCVLLGDAASTLPDPLQREGVVEVLLRLASSFVGDVDGDPLRDALVPTLCRGVIDVLHRDLGDAARHLVLRAGALSHHGELPQGNPYGARAWYVGTELSAVLGLRKMAVLPAVTIAAWRLIEAGDERWGSAQRLEALRGQLDASGRTASDWLTGLLQGAGLATTIGVPAATVPALAERTLRHWGQGLPMLPDLEPADVQRLVRDASRPPRPLQRLSMSSRVATPVPSIPSAL
ncbi:daptide-type RiPP biosynthesis dehydogenase [Microbacterium lacticum]|uniref:NADP-dependent alcohol dehydrogenase n=1 Tax=Microbacterium lacticum TaxID=33885 RepID=A0A4Y3URG3_9MICO|nr:daptide-type RiPP biosynthesis dehydogenase [Microbacterium lacticum]TQN00562.1 NADP-dependent alcohol dehydrogenase [Microbacterium lacticum]GEB96078.1 hypothetical protein MLA01_22970 [Microbacterium lacticum]GGI71713.1 hypothetical protein GCM10009724_23250 [Microbacterium lacticum]